MFNWICPKCKTRIEFPTLLALSLAERAGGCQGCRALETFKKKPELVRLFTDFWTRTEFPKSPSWTSVLQIVA